MKHSNHISVLVHLAAYTQSRDIGDSDPTAAPKITLRHIGNLCSVCRNIRGSNQ